ncbi:uncharacterized protein LY79DRAFT_569680, partial [Colletotrichum navitas]
KTDGGGKRGKRDERKRAQTETQNQPDKARQQTESSCMVLTASPPPLGRALSYRCRHAVPKTVLCSATESRDCIPRARFRSSGPLQTATVSASRNGLHGLRERFSFYPILFLPHLESTLPSPWAGVLERARPERTGGGIVSFAPAITYTRVPREKLASLANKYEMALEFHDARSKMPQYSGLADFRAEKGTTDVPGRFQATAAHSPS